MKIVFAASEMEPFAKTGGLADVMGSLSGEIRSLGHEVIAFLPRYKSIDPHKRGLQTVLENLEVPVGSEKKRGTLFGTLAKNGVMVYFVDHPDFFNRDAFYGNAAGDYPDNAERFALLSRAAVEVAQLHFRPEVFHCHDWQAGLVPVMLRTLYGRSPAVGRTPVLFTIHNLGFQGLFRREVLAQIGLPASLFTIDGLEFYGKVNLLKGGLVFSDAINTVSRGYAREIQTEEYGFGLDGLLRRRSLVLSGVLNGVDYGVWNPATDPHIKARYSAEDLKGKRECKRDLLKAFGLGAKDLKRPLIGVVSRLSAQKGADLIGEAAPELMAAGVRLVVLGSGDAKYEELFRGLAAQYPEQVGVRIAYDDALAHKIEAGADIFLMPSRYEPCGLNQIYSLKYGTVPVVRATGGLDDTVEEFDRAAGAGTGFKFGEYTAEAMMEAIRRALEVYGRAEQWERLMRNGMGRDYSWGRSAGEYVRLYEGLAAGRG